MGFYINPPKQTKEEFLKDHGKTISLQELKTHDWSSSKIPVCWVDNGYFTAAGIAYEKGEADFWINSFEAGDPRPHILFLVEKEVLKPYLPKHG